MSPYRIAAIFLDSLADACRRVYLRRPGRLRIARAEPMAEGFRYTLTLPPLDEADLDVAVRELSVTVDGVATTVSGAGDVTELKFEARKGSHVVVTLTDVDDDGLRSEASNPLEFDVTDTVPPHRPGDLSIASVEQVDLPEVPGPTP